MNKLNKDDVSVKMNNIKINIADSLEHGFFIKLMTDGLNFLGKHTLQFNTIDSEYMVFGSEDKTRLSAISSILNNKKIRNKLSFVEGD